MTAAKWTSTRSPPHHVPLAALAPYLVTYPMLIMVPVPLTLLEAELGPWLRLLRLRRCTTPLLETYLVIAEGYTVSMAVILLEGPLVRVRPVALGPMHMSTFRGLPIRRRILVVGSARVVTLGLTSCPLLAMVALLTVKLALLVLAQRGDLGATTPPRFLLATSRAPIRFRHLAPLAMTLEADATGLFDMEPFGDLTAMPPWALLGPTAMPGRGPGTLPGCTCLTSGLETAANWHASC